MNKKSFPDFHLRITQIPTSHVPWIFLLSFLYPTAIRQNDKIIKHMYMMMMMMIYDDIYLLLLTLLSYYFLNFHRFVQSQLLNF